jgi:hypothetical protein
MRLRLLLTTCLCLALSLPAAAQGAREQVIDRSRLAKLAQQPHRLFDDPQLACYLGGLLSREELEGLKKNMQLVSIDEPPDDTSPFVFTGAVRGLYTIMEGVVVVHPDGRLWGASLEDKRVKYFTNSPGSLKQPPGSINTWRERFEEKPLVPTAASRNVKPEELAARCSRERLSAGLELFSRALAGELCEPGLVLFSPFHPAVVKGGATGERVHFFSEPVSCPGAEACPSRQKAYLVENDAVELSSPPSRRNGFICAAYQGGKGKRTVGWLAESALSQTPLELPVGAGKLGRKPTDWVGTWSQSSGSIEIREASPERIKATGETFSGSHTGEFEQEYSVSGPVVGNAQAPGGAEDDTCQVQLRLFNNALLAQDNGACGGAAASFGGLYYRKAQH